MKDRCILWGGKPCGCMGIILHVDRDTDQSNIAHAKRVIKRRGYKLEWLSPEVLKARPWECSEHHAQRVRVAREKVAHQEQPALKG